MGDQHRIARLETELAELRRVVNSFPKTAAFSFPRERWLGKTVERSASYPTTGNGDTFEVELLSAAFSPVAPGMSLLTSRPRGPVVIARTWPSQYLPVGSYVIVDHIKGPEAGGEWWIAGGGAQAEVIRWARLDYAYPTTSGLVVSGGAWTAELTTDALDAHAGNAGRYVGNRLWIDVPGVYQVSAQATATIEPQLLSGGGFPATDWQFKLWAKNNIVGDGVQGYAQGRNQGITAYTTVTAVGSITVSSPGVVPFWLEGSSYFAPYSIAIKQWSLFLLKTGEA